MATPLQKLILYLKLLWNHFVFWTIPTLQETYYAKLGHIYFQLASYKKAISYFEKSEKSHNNDTTFSKFNWYYLGFSYLNLGHFNNAIIYFNQYLTLTPRDYVARCIVATCYASLSEFDKAIQSFQKASENGADNTEFWIEYARVLKEVGQKEKAFEYLQNAATKSIDEIPKIIINSMRYWFEGKLEETINILQQVLKDIADGKNSSRLNVADIYIMLSRIQKEIKDSSASLATLETAAALYPNDPVILNELALDYVEQEKNLDKAETLVTHALEYQPYNCYFLDTKGWILHKTGHSPEAMKIIQESLKLNPKSKETLEHMKSIQEAVR